MKCNSLHNYLFFKVATFIINGMSVKKNVSFDELIKQFEEALLQRNYTENYQSKILRRVKELRQFAGDEYYSSELCSNFLVLKLKEAQDKKKYTRKEEDYIRAVRYLSEVYSFGKIVSKSKKMMLFDWPQSYSAPIEAYLGYLVTYGKSKSYLKNNSRLLRELVIYLERINITFVQDIRINNISDFIKTFVGYADRTISTRISILRNFFKYLYHEEFITIPLSERIPKANKHFIIKNPKIWTEYEIKKIIESIDRGSPIGKRDYAMILLLIRYGIRIGDVFSLKLSYFDWEKKEFKVIQGKTDSDISLPILNDVGWAIIDYLKYGRPIANKEYLFLRHTPPFDRLSSSNNQKQVIDKYMRKAGITRSQDKKNGVHSFRHTLASELIQNGVEISTISQILGHSSIRTTYQYLKVNIKGLKKCALCVENLKDE